jgi:hypothetical protein
MTPELEKVLRESTARVAVEATLQNILNSADAAKACTIAHADKFGEVGGVPTWKETGQPLAQEIEAVKEFYAGFAGGVLLRKEENAADDVETEEIQRLATSAANGNLSDKGKLYMKLNKDVVKAEAAILKARGTVKDIISKPSTNPFSADAWNLTEQSRLFRVLGRDKCAALAASVGVTLGSTKPRIK